MSTDLSPLSMSCVPTTADQIFLADYRRDVDIGAFQEERGRRQAVRFDILADVRSVPDSFPADDVDRILSYDTLVAAVDQALQETRFDLLETLAERIAAHVLAAPAAAAVKVSIRKLDRGPFELGVTIHRTGAALVEQHTPADASARIVILSGAALVSEHLSHWIDQLVATGVPAILCPVTALVPTPKVGVVTVDRRIELLALEQSAWSLAARDARAVVVASKTELQHALKTRGMLVWAPSKMVLDAPPGAGLTSTNVDAGLALWLAKEIGAADVISLGESVANTRNLPLIAHLDLPE